MSGLILDTGPCGFLGFWSGVIFEFPLPTDVMVVLVSNVLLMQSAYLWNIVLTAYFISSLGMLSGPVALPLFSALAAICTSIAVIGIVRGPESLDNDSMGSTFWFAVNLFSKWLISVATFQASVPIRLEFLSCTLTVWARLILASCRVAAKHARQLSVSLISLASMLARSS